MGAALEIRVDMIVIAYARITCLDNVTSHEKSTAHVRSVSAHESAKMAPVYCSMAFDDRTMLVVANYNNYYY